MQRIRILTTHVELSSDAALYQSPIGDWPPGGCAFRAL